MSRGNFYFLWVKLLAACGATLFGWRISLAVRRSTPHKCTKEQTYAIESVRADLRIYLKRLAQCRCFVLAGVWQHLGGRCIYSEGTTMAVSFSSKTQIQKQTMFRILAIPKIVKWSWIFQIKTLYLVMPIEFLKFSHFLFCKD